MAGSLLTMPANGDDDWSGFVTIVQAAIKGSLFVSMTNFTGTSEPAIEDGSYCDINGAIYKLTANGSTESITGLAAIAVSSTVYVYAVPAGASVTVAGSTTAPTWSETKGGYYNGNNRCIGGLYKDAGGNYIDKWIIGQGNEAGNYFKPSGTGYGLGIEYVTSAGVKSVKVKRTKIIEIGDWDMDATGSVNIAHGLGGLYKNIINTCAIIRNDADSGYYNLETTDLEFGTDPINISSQKAGCIGTIDSTNILLARQQRGVSPLGFDSTDFNSTAYNRGLLIINYYE